MQFTLLILINFLMSAAYQLVTPLFAAYLNSQGTALEMTGILTGTFFFASLAVRPFCGRWADGRHKKTLLVGAAVLMTGCAAGYAAGKTLPVLLASRLIHGAAFAVGSTVSLSLSAACIPNKRLGQGMGLFGLGQTAAVAAGPALGLLLQGRFGAAGAFWGAAVCLAFTTLLAAGVRVGPAQQKSRPTRPSRRLLLIAALFIVFGALNGMDAAYVWIYAQQKGMGNIGWYFLIITALLLVSRPLLGRLADRKGLSVALLPAFFCAGLFCLAMWRMNGPVWLALGGICKGLTLGASQPALQAACLRAAGREHPGNAAAAFYMGADLGQGMGPVAGALVARPWGYGTMYLALLLPLVLAALACGWMKKRGILPGLGAQTSGNTSSSA